jgi:hypothetical protein
MIYPIAREKVALLAFSTNSQSRKLVPPQVDGSKENYTLRMVLNSKGEGGAPGLSTLS